MSNQPPADPDQPWKKPEEQPGRPSPDAATTPMPVSGTPWPSPSGDALSVEPYEPSTAPLPEPYEPPADAQLEAHEPGSEPSREPGPEPPTTIDPPESGRPAETPGPRPPAGPAFKPGYASLPKPPAAKPLPPTSMFPQQPPAAPAQSGGYPPQPDPSQPYPPPAPAGASPYSAPSPYQQYPATAAQPAQPGYAGDQPGYAPQQGYAPPPGQQGYTGQGYIPQQGYGGGYPPPPPPPGYAQPGYGRPPKRSKAPFVVLGVVIVLLLCAGGATAAVLAFNNAKDKVQEAVKPGDPFPADPFPTDDPEQQPTDDPGQPTEDPGQADPTDTGSGSITVVYEVTGDGPASIIYTDKLGGSLQRVENATLPWTHTTTMDSTALLTVTAIRTGTDDGSISCRATVDGQEVVQHTNQGAFASVSCIKFVS